MMKVGKPFGILSGMALVLASVVASPGAAAADDSVLRPGLQEASFHEVREGDTLWNLAGRYLSDPYRWTEIYDANRSVLDDPNQIYPGARLVLPGGLAETATSDGSADPRPAGPPARVVGISQTRSPQEATEGRRISRFGGVSVFDKAPDAGDVLGELDVGEYTPASLVSPSDFHRASYVVGRNELGPLAYTARSIEENPLKLKLPPSVRVNARVVVWLNGLSVQEDQTLEAFRFGGKLPGGRRIVHPLALLSVTRVEGDSARAVVTHLYGDYEVGDPVLPAESFSMDASVRLEPVEGGLVTELIGLEVRQDLLGTGDLVFLGVGAAAGVGPGDEFAVFSEKEQRAATARLEDRLVIVRLVRVRAASSTARIVDLRDTGTVVGAPARLIRRAGGG